MNERNQSVKIRPLRIVKAITIGRLHIQKKKKLKGLWKKLVYAVIFALLENKRDRKAHKIHNLLTSYPSHAGKTGPTSFKCTFHFGTCLKGLSHRDIQYSIKGGGDILVNKNKDPDLINLIINSEDIQYIHIGCIYIYIYVYLRRRC